MCVSWKLVFRATAAGKRSSVACGGEAGSVIGMPTELPPSPPVPALTTEDAATLRADLEASGWGVDAVADLLGPVADAALRREVRLPALQVIRTRLEADRAASRAPSAIAVLTALFMLGEPVQAPELDAALPRTGVSGSRRIGLVAPVGEDMLRAAVDLRPHEAVLADRTQRWWVASDVGELVSGRELAPDHVLGIGGAGLTLAGLTPRTPAARALDLGCGCGIQTLYLLQHCEHVTATDVSARALAFTAFNAALAGVGPGRLTLAQGSFLEPVAGQVFDLVATNPPFVITPASVRDAGLGLMGYRDAGGPVLPVLVPGIAAQLAPGGIAVMLGNWEHRGGQDWREHVGSWLCQDVDAWVVEREVQDPVAYAAMWLRDGGLTPERDRAGFEAALDAWVGDFEARGVQGVGLGYVVLHRPATGVERPAWRVLEEVTTRPAGPLGGHLVQVLAAHEVLGAMDDDAVAGLCPRTAPDVTEERHLVPGATEPTVILLRQGGGLGRVVRADTAMAALVGVADGELTVGQVASAVAALTGQDAGVLRRGLVEAVRELAHAGMLTPSASA